MWIFAVIFTSMLGACEGTFPRDPEGTSARVQRSRVVRVGATEHPPWIVRHGQDVRGPEAELIRRFAHALDVRVDFRFGQQEALLTALANFELDLVVGGLSEDTHFAEKVGLSRPWWIEPWGVGLAPNDRRTDVTGLAVVVAPEAMLAAALRKRGATPHERREPDASAAAVAAPLHVLQERGLRVVEAKLATRRYVVATPPGENGWLGALERYLTRDASELERLAKDAWR
jgi:polar amino acid transport system substrate-binding protein